VCIDADPEYVITKGNNSGEPCTLKIRRLDKTKHSGVYSIKATNPGGEVTSSANVNVIGQPAAVVAYLRTGMKFSAKVSANVSVK